MAQAAMKWIVLPIWNRTRLALFRVTIRESRLVRLKAPDGKEDLGKYGYPKQEDIKHGTKYSNVISDHVKDSPVVTKYVYTPDSSEMRSVFHLFDENNDCLICAEDLGLFMKRLGFEVSDDEVRGMVQSIDRNSDEYVDFEEFSSLYNSLCSSKNVETSDISDGTKASCAREEDDGEEGSLLEAFYIFDKDKDGFISALELQNVLNNLGMSEGRSLRSCQRMIQSVDGDGNGQVDFNEFKVMMRSNPF